MPTAPAWTPVALSRDILSGTSNPAQVGGQDLAVWRSESGHIAAWADRCPHRGMRLSHGFVRGEVLNCIYHGWNYGSDGRCQRIPAHPDLVPPDAIRVPRFAVMESSGVVWVAAAEEAPSEAPRAYPGFTGYRSLRIEAPFCSVEAALGEAGLVRLGAVEVVVLIQALKDGATGLHLLAAEGADAADLDALSRAAEALRRDVEDREEVVT